MSLSSPAYAGARVVADDAPDDITVEVLANNGSGCAPGTARVFSFPDRTGFRVRYNDFVAEAGGGAPAAERRKNCQTSVLVTTPAGFTFAIASAEYRGRASLRSGATGLHRTTYYWQGSSEDHRKDKEFEGPFNGFWADLDVAPVLVFAPCSGQRVLNINTELRVDAGTSHGRSSLSMRTQEGDVDTLFNFSFKRC